MLPRLYKQRSPSITAPYQFFFMGSYIVLLYYLLIYFQTILGASPIQSGVDNLPLMFALAGGGVVMKTGCAQQVMFVGSMLGTVTIGLIYTLDIGSSTGKWAGYQVFVGATPSFVMMHSLTVAQANVGPEDLSTVTANLLSFQTVGGAFSISSGQAAFINRLLATLPKTAPDVNPALVLATGASELHNVFPPDVLPGVLEAYMIGIKAAFSVVVAFAGTAFLLTFAIPMKKLPSHATGEAPIAMVKEAGTNGRATTNDGNAEAHAGHEESDCNADEAVEPGTGEGAAQKKKNKKRKPNKKQKAPAVQTNPPSMLMSQLFPNNT
ncbi:uncharacterized protein BCR38DRAFT_527572 [Pseudomassariella vexata]|uniref:Major facilitator superfamily domain-containing protein n=1 Tax=Pseudomassariella vexata TaxID=1141098 RepID=A0A1Y2DH16_9PEZI|nr:uncharacterized protein BCR38DRAFT_527572 [Pseudomassariella vexata]ORY58559.1 hypothetical protein BCR38DRAFT_527572 [Pseudomassariella vexata]